MIPALLLLLLTATSPGPPPDLKPEDMATGKGLLWSCSRVVNNKVTAWDFPEGYCLGQLRSVQGMIEITRLRAEASFRDCNKFCAMVNDRFPISPPRVCADVCELSQSTSRWPICLPKDADLNVAAQAVVSYLQAHPDEQPKAATTVLIDALLERFPCPR